MSHRRCLKGGRSEEGQRAILKDIYTQPTNIARVSTCSKHKGQVQMCLNVAHSVFKHLQDETETYFVQFILIRVLQKIYNNRIIHTCKTISFLI